MKINSLRSLLPATTAVCLFMACLRDAGIVEPDKEGNRPVLASFQGRARTLEDRNPDFEMQRLGNFPNPKVALVWEFIGTKVVGSALGNTVVSTASPFAFSIKTFGLPPPEVIASTEPVFGHFWLYSDRNGNETFDRLTHPEVAKRLRIVDSLRDIWAIDEKRFQESARVLPSLVSYSDTFFVDRSGTLIRKAGTRKDTLYRGTSPSDTNTWNDILHRRFWLLRNHNNWENFFGLRKRARESIRERLPSSEYAYRLVFHDWTRMVPKPGMEAEFEERLRIATLSYLMRFATLGALERESFRKGWADYPYDGFLEPGQDWAVGRSRWYHVVYFPDSASMDVALEAERKGSFRVDGLDRLHRGYNVLHCDDQYRCHVLVPGDSIYIDAGQKEAYFNPPASPLVFPVKDFKPAPAGTAEPGLRKLESGYRYNIYGPVTTVSMEGSLWADLPRLGLLRLVPVDSMTFYVPGRDFQFEFVPSPRGEVYKLMIYSEGNRFVTTPDPALARDRETREKVAARLGRERARLPDSLAAGLPRTFFHGPDTLRVDYAAGGDSLVWRLPRIPSQAFHPLNDSQAHSLHTGDQLTFRRNSQGTVTGIFLSGAAGEFLLPALDYRPRMGGDLFPGASGADSLVSSAEGPAPARGC